MHSWRIAQRGGRLERVRTNSSDDVCQTFETRLSTQVQILTWRTSKHGQHGGLLHGGREHLRGWEGRVCFTLFHLVYKFPWLVRLAWCLAFVWVLVFWVVLGLFVVCFGFCSQGDLIAIDTNSSSWPTMSRTSPALQEKKKQSFPEQSYLFVLVILHKAAVWKYKWLSAIPMVRCGICAVSTLSEDMFLCMLNITDFWFIEWGFDLLGRQLKLSLLLCDWNLFSYFHWWMQTVLYWWAGISMSGICFRWCYIWM